MYDAIGCGFVNVVSGLDWFGLDWIGLKCNRSIDLYEDCAHASILGFSSTRRHEHEHQHLAVLTDTPSTTQLVQ